MHNNEYKDLPQSLLSILGSFLPVFFWILVIFSFDDPLVANLTLCAAFIHESGHFLYILLSGKKIKNFRGISGGLKIVKTSYLSYFDELFLCLFGPLANITVGLLSLVFLNDQNRDYIVLFLVINIITAFSNFLPIEGYDGYRILSCILQIFGKYESGVKVLQLLSFGLIIFFSLLSLYLMIKLDGGYWMYATFAVILYKTVKHRLKTPFSR